MALRDIDSQSLPGRLSALEDTVDSLGGGGGTDLSAFTTADIEAAADGTQESATALGYGFNIVNGVAGKGDSVIMPAAITGAWVAIRNDTGNQGVVYPAIDENFLGSATNAAISLVVHETTFYLCVVAGSWTKPSAPAAVVDLVSNQSVDGEKRFNDQARFDAGVDFTTGEVGIGCGTVTLVSNAHDFTDNVTALMKVTTEGLTTAAGAAQAFVLTVPGVSAVDVAIVSQSGGTNTRKNLAYEAICTTDTVTVTVHNTEPINAVNGTLKFNVLLIRDTD